MEVSHWVVQARENMLQDVGKCMRKHVTGCRKVHTKTCYRMLESARENMLQDVGKCTGKHVTGCWKVHAKYRRTQKKYFVGGCDIGKC